MACKINLFECVVNEGSRLLQEEKEQINEQVDKSDLEEVKSFLDELKVTKPELFNNPINPNIIEDLHKVSDNIKQTYIRKKERRESVKEKRRNSWSRKLSFEERQEPPRRHSEGGSNARFKSTEWINHKNPSGAKHTTRHSSTPDTNSGVRRRNSGGNSDMMRGAHADSFRRQMSEGVPQQIPEVSQMTKDVASAKLVKNSDSQYKRRVSWCSKIVTEIPKYENWRKEGSSITNLNPD